MMARFARFTNIGSVLGAFLSGFGYSVLTVTGVSYAVREAEMVSFQGVENRWDYGYNIQIQTHQRWDLLQMGHYPLHWE